MSYYIIESKRFQRGLPISFIILKSWIKDDIVDGKVNNIYIYIYIYHILNFINVTLLLLAKSL